MNQHIVVVCMCVQRAVVTLQAHNSTLAAISFNSQATCLASASVKVTTQQVMARSSWNLWNR